MTRTATQHLAVVILGMALALGTACAPDAARFTSAEDLAKAVAAADIACDASDTGGRGTLVSDQSSCSADGTGLQLYVFHSDAERDQWLRVGAQLSPVAIGPNWTASGPADITRRVASALHATYESPAN